jgi:hypothetical protein
MPKYVLQFETKIRGQVTVEADSWDEAEQLGEEYAMDTLNYEELEDQGKCAPDVETEFTDMYEQKNES